MAKNNIHIVNLAAYEAPIIKESKRDAWVDYGENNMYYEWLLERYINSTTNNAVINNISRLVYGKGLRALDASRKPAEYAQMMSIFSKDCVRKMALDFKMLGQFAMQVLYTKDHKKIAKIYHMPVQLLRAEKCDENGDILGYYYSDNWGDIKKYAPKRYSAFGTSKDEIEILFTKPYSVGMKYYSYVDYQGALPYAVLEEETSDYLINLVQSSFSPGTILNFNNGVPSEEQQQAIKSQVLNKLTGSHGDKVVVSFNTSKETACTIENIPVDQAPELYKYISQEAITKILIGHNVTSPLLFGIATTTGFSANADELKNSAILFDNMVITPMQEMMLDAFDKVLAYNDISLNLYFETLNPLDAKGDLTTTDEATKVTDAINMMSPLVANKVLESMTPEEIRALVGLKPAIMPAQLSKDSKIASALIDKGMDPDSTWVLIDEFVVNDDEEDEIDAELEKANRDPSLLQQISTGIARPRGKSDQDKIIDGVKFITRYRYDGAISDNSREFCRKMIAANKLYKKEDILNMGDMVVNEGWGPEGAKTYSIWKYKGGGACGHKWIRQTWAALGVGVGIDPTSPLANQISTNAAEKKGYRIRNDREVSMMPRDMPYQGFLPTNKRFN